MARKRFASRGPKRHGDWSASSPQGAGGAIGPSSAVLMETFTPTGAGETLIRSRGIISVRSDQVIATEEFIGAVGLGVVSAQAASVGITAIPHPATDAAWGGWLWHSYFSSVYLFRDATGSSPNGVVLINVDSKAMRKVGEEERLVAVVENSAADGTLVVSQFRFYSKPF